MRGGYVRWGAVQAKDGHANVHCRLSRKGTSFGRVQGEPLGRARQATRDAASWAVRHVPVTQNRVFADFGGCRYSTHTRRFEQTRGRTLPAERASPIARLVSPRAGCNQRHPWFPGRRDLSPSVCKGPTSPCNSWFAENTRRAPHSEQKPTQLAERALSPLAHSMRAHRASVGFGRLRLSGDASCRVFRIRGQVASRAY